MAPGWDERSGARVHGGIADGYYVVSNIEAEKAAFVGLTDDVMLWNACPRLSGRQHDNVASIPPSVLVGCQVEFCLL